MRYISAVVLLSCVAMSAAFGAELSGDQVATDNGVLKGIDIAFLPMNLPPTMSVAKAADAIREFKPKIVYPYHYRSGDKTKADMEELKRLVGKDSGVEIRVRDWYPEEPIHDSAQKESRFYYGTLQSETDRQRENYQAGLRIATMEISWDRFEPRQGVWDDTYIARMKKKKWAFETAGMKVVLECGLQYPPKWVWALPNSCYVNQHGSSFSKNRSPGMNSLNMVFNAKMRDLQSTYRKRIFQELGTDFIAVRLGGGWFGELNYPPCRWDGKDNCYWAYDPIAQGKAEGLPTGVKPCPVPDWKPGTSSKDHASARLFLNWYLDSLKNYHDWQIETTRRLFASRLLMLYPSFGVRQGQLEPAIAGDLSGSTSPEKNGEIQRGFDFARYINGIKDPKVVVYCTWVDCPFGDDTSSNPANWTPPRFLADLARRKGIEIWGENSGPEPRKTMERCFATMDRCGMTGFLWAFEPQLYDGKSATIDDYKQLIALRRAGK